MTRKQKRLKDRRRKGLLQDYVKLFGEWADAGAYGVTDDGEPIVTFADLGADVERYTWVAIRIRKGYPVIVNGQWIARLDECPVIRIIEDPFNSLAQRFEHYKHIKRVGKLRRPLSNWTRKTYDDIRYFTP